MSAGLNDFQHLCDWFNSLNMDTQMSILNYITDRSDELNIIPDDEQKLNELIDCIRRLIVDKNDEEDSIIATLLEVGLDKVFAVGFYNFSRNFAVPYIDAKIINKMTKNNLQNLCLFVINHFFLYDNYYEIPFNEFMKHIGFENEKKKAQSSVRFIKNHYLDVCNRKYSSLTLQKKLLNEYSISDSKADIIINLLNKNLPEMYQAHLIRQVNSILNKLSYISKNENKE